MEVFNKDFYCYECSLQFDKKYVFDVHLSVVHGEKLNIKQEPGTQPSVIHEVKELEIKQQGEENTWKNEPERRKVIKKKASGRKGKEKNKCDICNANFERKTAFEKTCCNSP